MLGDEPRTCSARRAHPLRVRPALRDPHTTSLAAGVGKAYGGQRTTAREGAYGRAELGVPRAGVRFSPGFEGKGAAPARARQLPALFPCLNLSLSPGCVCGARWGGRARARVGSGGWSAAGGGAAPGGGTDVLWWAAQVALPRGGAAPPVAAPPTTSSTCSRPPRCWGGGGGARSEGTFDTRVMCVAGAQGAAPGPHTHGSPVREARRDELVCGQVEGGCWL